LTGCGNPTHPLREEYLFLRVTKTPLFSLR
jgi:hypothetical protein